MLINSKLLETARESRGYTQIEAAKLLGISQAKLSKAERGEQKLPIEIMDKVVKVYDYPISFFNGDQDLSPDGHLYFRRRLNGSAKMYTQIIAKTKILKRIVDILASSVEIPECKLYSFDTRVNTPEDIALKARYLLGIHRGRVPNLSNLLEANGIFIIEFDFGTEKMDGLSTITNKGCKIIFLNSSMPNDRKRFSLAHELGHMLMHIENTPQFPEEVENEANRFASEFLMPAEEIRSNLNRLNIEKLADLKRQWHVSMKSLIYRAHTLKTITDIQNRNWQITFSKKGFNKAEPIPLPKEKPQLVEKILQLFRNELHYNDYDIMEMLNINFGDFSIYFKPEASRFNLTLK